MKIRHMAEFVHLAESCNYLDAAEDLYISQSSLSKHIKAMEKELGLSLFYRTTRSVVLSEYGHAFYPVAKRIVAEYNGCLNDMRTLRLNSEKNLSIGALGFISSFGLYEKVHAFQDLHPDMTYEMVEARDERLTEYVSNKRCDFILTSNIADYERFEYRVFREEPICLAISENHPLAQHDVVHPEDLENIDILLHGQPIDFSSIRRYCERHDINARFDTEISFYSTILKFVSEGRRATLITAALAGSNDGYNGSIKLIPFEPNFPFRIYFVYRKESELSSIAREFIDYCCE